MVEGSGRSDILVWSMTNIVDSDMVIYSKSIVRQSRFRRHWDSQRDLLEWNWDRTGRYENLHKFVVFSR